RFDDSGAPPRRGGATRPGGAEGRRISQGRIGGPVRNRPGKDGPQGRIFQKGWRREEPAPVGGSEARFSDLLMQAARKAAPDMVEHPKHPEPLARLDYALELELKNKALQDFWIARGLPDKPNKILPSPRPRHYRTTSKRRIVHVKGRFEFTNLSSSQDVRAAKAAADSRVEPLEHKAIYSLILAKLNTSAYAQLAHALNYVIIRGDYARFTVLLNVHKLSGDVVRKAKLLSGHLQEMDSPKVGAAFVFYDPSRSEFYLEARNAEGPWKMKKLFGPDDMHLQVLDRTYTFHPTAFCQVNASILPLFLEKSVQLLKPKPEYRLLDLYSGFGFFTLHLGPSYGEAHGVDFGSGSIDSAQRMAKADPGSRCTFRSGRIQVKTLGKLLPPASPDRPEAILLDPPRQGTEPGVIRALASRAPARILHIFCDLDTLPKEVNQWRKCGYMVSKVLPLDMFPGTDNLEVMVLFIPDRYGILNRIDKGQHDRKTDPEAALAPEESGSGDRKPRPSPFSNRPARQDASERPRRGAPPGRPS